MNTYIIVYPDGTMTFWRNKPKARDYIRGSKLYRVPSDTPISVVSNWVAKNYLWFPFKEVKDW
jgi:hypothetical protein